MNRVPQETTPRLRKNIRKSAGFVNLGAPRSALRVSGLTKPLLSLHSFSRRLSTKRQVPRTKYQIPSAKQALQNIYFCY